jgi:hypothetical protein
MACIPNWRYRACQQSRTVRVCVRPFHWFWSLWFLGCLLPVPFFCQLPLFDKGKVADFRKQGEAYGIDSICTATIVGHNRTQMYLRTGSLQASCRKSCNPAAVTGTPCRSSSPLTKHHVIVSDITLCVHSSRFPCFDSRPAPSTGDSPL